MHGGIQGFQTGKLLVAQRRIYMRINDTNGAFHHGFITRTIGPCCTKSGCVMFTQLVADISKHRFIAAGADDSRLQIIA